MSIQPSGLETAAERVNSDVGISVGSDDDLVKLASDVEVETEGLSDALQLAAYLLRKAIDGGVSTDELLDEVREACAAKEIPGFDDRRQALKKLLTPTEKYELLRKVTPFALGAERLVDTISGVVQLRAVFDPDDSSNLICYYPLAVIKLSTRYSKDKDADVERESFTVQLTERTLDSLIEKLQVYRSQLATVKLEAAGKLDIFQEEPE